MEIKSHGDGSEYEFDGIYNERGCGEGNSFGSCNCEKRTFTQSDHGYGYGYIECSDRDLIRNGIAYGSGDGAYCKSEIN